jgi:hypothetical protein
MLMAQSRVIAMVEIQLLYEIMSSAVSTGLQAYRCLPDVCTSRCNPMNPLVRHIWRIMADDVGTEMSGPKQF